MEKIKDFIKRLNEYGVPLPLFRIDGKASLTGTMVAISFAFALFGEFAKLSKLFGEIDLTQANYLFLICLGNYAHKRIVADPNKKTITLEEGKTDV